MSLLKVENLQAGYGKKTILQKISLSVSSGKIIGILGANGCGKSTLIKALCKGLAYQGKASVEGQDIKKMSEKELAKICAYVPQNSGLAIDISVLEVVLMGFYPHLGMLERPNKEMKKKAIELLTRVGLEKELHRNYMELSEGQKRLCILARSLVADAKLLVMDEPDASLDFGIKNHLMQLIQERVSVSETGVLLSLHDIDMALSYCHELYLMKEGTIIAKIVPQEETITSMEKKLSAVYGTVRLIEYENKETRKLIMVQA